MILAIISWILFGLLAGLIAKWIMPGPDGGGFIVTTVLGIAGAIIGGFLARLMGYGVNEIGSPGFLLSLFLAVLGAVILLGVYRLATGRELTA